MSSVPVVVLTPMRGGQPVQNGEYFTVSAEYSNPVLAAFYRFLLYPWAYQNSSQGSNSGPITPTTFPS